MRISDWSSDVCSSDLQRDYPEGAWHHPRRCDAALPPAAPVRWLAELRARTVGEGGRLGDHGQASSQRGRRLLADAGLRGRDRKSVVSGKRVSVRVDLGGGRHIKKKKQNHTNKHNIVK